MKSGNCQAHGPEAAVNLPSVCPMLVEATSALLSNKIAFYVPQSKHVIFLVIQGISYYKVS